jgi:hypothetical protein
MFHLLASILKTAFYATLLHEQLKTKFPDKYNEVLVEITYKLIYFYSNCQIILKKRKTHIQQFIENKINHYPKFKSVFQKMIYNKNDKNTMNIEFILDNKTVCIQNILGIKDQPLQYDFAIFSEYNIEHDYVNKRIVQKVEDWDNLFQESNVQFFVTEVTINNKVYEKDLKNNVNKVIKVDLKTEKYNFYLVNNKLDEKFMKYFLTTYYSNIFQDIDMNSIGILVTILDQNVNKFAYKLEEDYIHITKTNYFRKTDIITED